MAHYDIILKGGTIVDGTLTPRYVSDVAIKDGKVAKIGGIKDATAAKVLDAKGLIVAPGFVDLHTHYDAQIQWDPYCTLSGWHGVTSVTIGNCGFGFAPCEPEDRERAMLALTRTEAIPFKSMQEGMLWDWVTFPEFLDSLDRIPKGVNVNTLVPLTPFYGWVMGWQEAKTRRPTQEELEKMCQLVLEGIDAGACGWSAQVSGPNSVQRDYDGTPMITDLMTDEEILTFAKLMQERDDGFIELTYGAERDEKGIIKEEPRMRLFEKVAETAGRPVLYQVVTPNSLNPDIHRNRLKWLAECAEKGIKVYGQGATTKTSFEFTFEDWNLFDTSPTWREVTMGTPGERLDKMKDPAMRQMLREETDKGVNTGVGNVESLIVEEVAHPQFEEYEGMTIKEIAEKEGKHIIDALLDLVVSDELATEFISNTIGGDSAEYTAEVLKSPYVIPGVSDGGAHVKFLTSGNFPTEMLMWMVRDEQRISLEEAHYKLSYLPAFMGGFKDRGFLREGAPADIVVYNLDKLDLKPTEVANDLPGDEWRRIQKPEGYRWIMVNGEMTFEDGEPTGALPGKFLRHGRG